MFKVLIQSFNHVNLSKSFVGSKNYSYFCILFKVKTKIINTYYKKWKETTLFSLLSRRSISAS